MKIMRLAAGGKVRVKVVINYETGEVEAHVIHTGVLQDHETEANKMVVRNLLDGEVEGFGKTFQATDSGLTEEGLALKMKDRGLSQPNMPSILQNKPVQPVYPSKPEEQTPEEENKSKVGLGYGV